MPCLQLIIHREIYAIAKLESISTSVSEVLSAGRFAMVSRLDKTITLVCHAEHLPKGGDVSDGFRLIEIQGDFALDSTGVVAAVASPLAAADIALFAFSVWNTDVFLIHERDLVLAKHVLSEVGHVICER